MKKQKNNQTWIHGIDVVDLTRVEFKNKALATKLLHPSEIQYYQTLRPEQQVNYLGVIWALKEAIFKALNTSIVYPELHLYKAHDQYQCVHDEYDLVLSVSYCNQFVFASVIGFKKH